METAAVAATLADAPLSQNASLLASFAVALAVGLLVGIERQRAMAVKAGASVLFGGVRTFPLVALAGSVAVVVADATTAPLVVAGALVALVALLVAHRLGLAADKREEGLTTEVAALFTFLVGALATTRVPGLGDGPRWLTCAALGVVCTLLLSVKPKLHDVVKRISDEDLLATVQLLVLAVVALPLLPDRAYGPFNAINPQTIGRMILFVGFVSFVGYVASRLLGNRRGLTVAGFVGGLVSSTAVTFAMSRRAKADPRLTASCAVAVVAASSMMFARVLIAALVVHPPLALSLAPTLGAMLAAGAVGLVVLFRRARASSSASSASSVSSASSSSDADKELQNPFELKSAVVFGLLFAGVTFVAHAVRATLGDALLPLAGLVAGTTDVDAITLSTAGLARDGVSLTIATLTIAAACLANTAVKAGVAVVVGGRALGVRVALVFLAMALAGAAAFGIELALT